MNDDMDLLLFQGEKAVNLQGREEGLHLHQQGGRHMHKNEEGEEALHSLRGVDGLLLHLILLQVMVMSPALLLDPREAIIPIHIDQEESILPGSALEK